MRKSSPHRLRHHLPKLPDHLHIIHGEVRRDAPGCSQSRNVPTGTRRRPANSACDRPNLQWQRVATESRVWRRGRRRAGRIDFGHPLAYRFVSPSPFRRLPGPAATSPRISSTPPRIRKRMPAVPRAEGTGHDGGRVWEGPAPRWRIDVIRLGEACPFPRNGRSPSCAAGARGGGRQTRRCKGTRWLRLASSPAAGDRNRQRDRLRGEATGWTGRQRKSGAGRT